MNDGQTITQLTELANELKAAGRYDLLLQAIGVPALHHLNVEAARARLSPLVITSDYRFLLPSYDNREVLMSPLHKALYILFLNHPEGIEFKALQDHRDELRSIYQHISNRTTSKTIDESIDRLINPLDNSVNEKCTRIKAAFAAIVDTYQLTYYAISSHTQRHISGSSRVWFERKKTITLPRELVQYSTS